MSENEKALPQAGPEKLTQNSAKTVQIDRKDRIFLVLTLAFCVLLVDTFLFNLPGAGITVAVAAWYGLLLAYMGKGRLRRGESRFLLAVNLLLAMTFAVTSNWYFRLWNLGALLLLLPIHATALSGAANRPWWQASMLTERLRLLLEGVFCNLGAVGAAATGAKKGPGKRIWTAVLGSAAAAAMVLLLLPVLSSADALFSSATGSFLRFCREHLTGGIARLLLGLALTPFLFGLLYALRRPRGNPVKAAKDRTADPLLFVILLSAMIALYLLFLGVQSAGLFGGAEYLARRGIRYADWARSGFFQMTGVTAVNLAVTLTAVRFSSRGRGGWHAVSSLTSALIAESFLLLASAGWRMTLYVSAYGLSFKRVMTYWGMVMMAIFLTAALLSVRKKDFSFCRAAFLAALIGWVAINCVPVDALVAKDSVDRYLAGESAVVDVSYLTGELSYDTLRQLERLDGKQLVRAYDAGYKGPNLTLGARIGQRREAARCECARWESWSLSASLAGRTK
jgi:hypothetical protein